MAIKTSNVMENTSMKIKNVNNSFAITKSGKLDLQKILYFQSEQVCFEKVQCHLPWGLLSEFRSSSSCLSWVDQSRTADSTRSRSFLLARAARFSTRKTAAFFPLAISQHRDSSVKLKKRDEIYFLQETAQGGRRRGRQRKRWEDDIKKWTGLEWNIIPQKAETAMSGGSWL